MTLQCGIVGLPNVGKSTLFNALTKTQAAEAANYPFCTIDPNTGRVGVPDKRQDKIAALAKSENVIPTQIEFVDIAGLVKGASKGEGLGNQFLANIRETDAIVHVLRCFEGEVTHVDGSVDPVRDAETVNTELMIADMESIEKRIVSLSKRAKSNDKEATEFLRILEPIKQALEDGNPARTVDFSEDDKPLVKQLQLITTKPILYVCNVGDDLEENDHTKAVQELAKRENANAVTLCASLECELAVLDDADRDEFMADLGITETGLEKLINSAYNLLGLLTFFTAGPKECRAWTTIAGAKAPQAAGVIHTDFQRGFICAETIGYSDYVNLGGEQNAKEQGKSRQEGKEYLVKDGDIFHFRHNV